MNKYRFVNDLGKVAIETSINRVREALLDRGYELVETKLAQSHIHTPQFAEHTSKIVSYSPKAVAAVVSVLHIPLEDLDAVKAILLDLGVIIEQARE